jgi:hypothetical protein
MPNLVLKLVVTPALIGVATVAGRRWGPAVGGWLVGLPFTSGPVALFLALDHGAGFAAGAATGMLAGTISQAAFALAYGWVASRGPWLASGAGFLAFGGATLALDRLSMGVFPALVATFASTALAIRFMPAQSPSRPGSGPPPRWDAPMRMAVATAFVLGLTASAPRLGPQLSGLLSPFPFFGLTLALFAHRQQGQLAAVAVLRGLLHGLFAPAVFFFVLGDLLLPAGIALAFAAAGVAALVTQGLALWALRSQSDARVTGTRG